jgi:predicted nicotinamide N-methyase
MRNEEERQTFIRAQTRLEPVPLVPEISIYAASLVTPLWTATQETLDLHDLEPPFWAFAWAGGQALARFVLDNPEHVRGRVVFDFASGSGMVGIAAKMAGASRVLCSDIDTVACTATRLNAGAADLSIEASDADRVGELLDGFDVVLAGDVFYDRSAAERFGPWFEALAKRGRLVLVGDPGRAYFPGGLEALATYDVPVPFDLESTTTKPATVYRYPARAVPSPG